MQYYSHECNFSMLCTNFSDLTLCPPPIPPHQLLDFLSDSDEGTAEDVLVFVREAIQRYPQLKGNVVGKLLEVFSLIKSVK